MKKRINEQIIHLKEKGFIVKDEEKVKWYLEKVWLYRLSRYFINFKNYEWKMDLSWVDFMEIINHYLFDKNLRILNLNIIESIEIFIKNIFILKFWNSYLDKKIYSNKIIKIKNKEIKIQDNRKIFINKKIKELLQKDEEVKNILKKYKILNAEVFINKLTFWEIVRFIQDLNKENKIIFSQIIWIKIVLLENWLDCLVYLRNISSHWENIFNKKMLKTIEWNKINGIFWIENNNRYITYFIIISIFKEALIPSYKWEEKVFKKMKQYNIKMSYFWEKKETFPNELESEAWKVLVNPLYRKYVKKSNFNKTFSIILAVDEKNWLWKNNTLAWNLKADLNYFKKTTTETEDSSKFNTVLMWRNTRDSIPEKYRPLPNRINCILSRDFKNDDINSKIDDFVLYYNDFEKCLEDISQKENVENIFLIGWASLYNQMRNHKMLDKIYITRIFWDYNCDVFFDGIDNNKFEIINGSEILEENNIKYRFEVYKKLA